MAGLNGYYSLVQYCPDRSRLEAANIGVLLVCPDLGFADVRFSGGYDRVRRFFRTENIDHDAIESAKQALRNRVRKSASLLMEPDSATAFLASRGNEIVLAPLRPVKIDTPQETLQELFAELVGGRVRRAGAVQPVFRDLDFAFRHTPELYGKILFNERVTLPIVNKRIVAPYAYRNGALNLIKPERFAGTENATTGAAMRLAVEGDLLYRHTREDPARLVVVADFDAVEAPVRGRVVELLHEYHVRSFDAAALPDLLREVAETAH